MVPYDPHRYAYPSQRRVVYGARGMVCTGQNLAAEAGLEIMKAGGNAIDAAVATAAALTVLEPTSNGVGGDAFALVWSGGKLHGLNSSGPAPIEIDVEAVRREHNGCMPQYGWTPVTVPGIPAAWAELTARFGRLPLEETLAPAIRYAEEGYPVSPVVSEMWGNAYRRHREALRDPVFEEWFRVFAPHGRAPGAGELFRLPELAKTLALLAKSGCESFYRGELAEWIDAFSRSTGGYLRGADLAAFYPKWVEPIRVDYRGYTVWEIPPNGHGIVALMALNILAGFDFSDRNTEAIHRQLEAMKLAFADGLRYIADPRAMTVTPAALLDPAYAAERRALIGSRALTPEPGTPDAGGTVYLSTADGDGNMVSYIQSNYIGFGSGLVVPGTGIALHNRGHNFSLDPAGENCLAPGKRPYHTIIPGFLTKGGEAVGPFGVMGAFMQPQGHVQVVTNILDFGMNPQEALDAPRWQWTSGKTVLVERGFPFATTEELIRRGHDIQVAASSMSFGRGQVIWRDPSGVLVGGTEPRADGMVAAW